MKKSGLLFLAGLFIINLISYGQMVYTEPAIPYADEAVTVYFNAAGTPLEGYTGNLYTHTGVTVNGNQWQNVIGTWGNNAVQPQLTNIGTDLFELEITPSIYEFYSVELSDVISEMCFVFRSSDSPYTQTDPDIFIEVFEVGLNVQITLPDISPYFVDPGESINVVAEASEADEMSLYVDDVLIATVSGNALNETITAGTEPDTKKWIKVVANDQTDEVADSIYYYVRGTTEIADLPEGVVDGINYIDNQTVTLVLHAPLKSSIYAFGDFSNWQIDPAYKLKRTYSDPNNPSTRYWVTITGLNPGEEYAFQYLVDETIRVTDPYSEKILDPWNDKYIPEENYPNLKPYPIGKTESLVSVFQTNQEEFEWQIENFEAPDQTNLIVYELLIRDFIGTENYQTLADTINYLKTLGVNAIELMPINEFDGNNSWGYNPNHYFALDKQYGTKNNLKAFIDVCHGHGIAVILDVVFNHATGISPYCKLYWDDENNRPAQNSPFYNPEPKHDFNVFHDMNHESPATKLYISRAIEYWIEEYKVDGYRLDLSKGLTQNNTLGDPNAMAQYDPSRINILNHYADAAWAVNPDAYFILEHFADNSEEEVLSDDGMMVWGNINYNYNEATMGWNESGKSNFSWISYKQRGWNDPHVMGYMESHDEERLMYKNVTYGNSASGYNIKELTTALERQQLSAAFFFTIPGPKMIWQFGELGYDYSKYYDMQTGQVIEGDDGVKVSPKPIRWDYKEDFRREALYNVYSSLIHLKKEEPAFSTSDFSLNVNYAMKSIHLNHSSMNVTILGNFGVASDNMDPDFQHTGYWYDYFAGDSLNVTDVNAEITLNAGEYRIYTDVKLEKPEIGLGINNHSKYNSSINAIYPNPSDDQFNISLNLVDKAFVEVKIYNLNGQHMASVYNGQLLQGKHTIVWQGLNDGGYRVKPGMYMAELMVNGNKEVKKLIVK